MRQLANELREAELNVWYDEFSLRVGDSLRASIDKGLANSRFGIVVLSPEFFRKDWTKWELDGLVARQNSGGKVILPIWHGIDQKQIQKYSPPLANLVALRSDSPMKSVVSEIVDRVSTKSAGTSSQQSGLLKQRKKSQKTLGWKISVVSPAPIDHDTSHFSHRLFETLAGLAQSEVDVLVEGVVPQGLAGIEALATAGNGHTVVLHVHAKLTRGRLVLEGRDSKSELTSADSLATALNLAGANLLVLTGDAFGSFAEELSSSTDVPVVFSTKRLNATQLSEVVLSMYRRLFAFGDVRSPKDDGEIEHLRFVGSLPVRIPATGTLRFSETYEALRRRSRNSRTRVHNVALQDALQWIRRKDVVEIYAPEGSGISTALRILSDYMRFERSLFHHGSIVVDLKHYSTIEQILTRVCEQLEIESVSMANLLTKHSIGFCVDGGEDNPELLRELLAEVERADARLLSKFIIGLVKPGRASGAQKVQLNQLTFEEKITIARSELTPAQVNAYRSAIEMAIARPSAIYELIYLVRRGRTLDEVCERIDNADTEVHEDLVRSLDSNSELHPLLRVVATLGNHFPIEVARNAFEQAAGLRGVVAPYAVSGQMIDDLLNLGVMSPAEPGDTRAFRYNVNSTTTYITVTPGIIEPLKGRFPVAISMAEPGFAESVAAAAVGWLSSHFPTIAADGGWLTSVARELYLAGDSQTVSKMAELLIDFRSPLDGPRAVPLRSTGDAIDIRELLQIFSKSTEQTGPRSLYERALLFYAETCYKLDETQIAVDEFSAQIRNPAASDGLRLRANRALGQIALRGAEYSRALDYFDVASAYVADVSPDDVITLLTEQAKLHLRLGSHELARDLIGRARILVAPTKSIRLESEVKMAEAHLDRYMGNVAAALDQYIDIAVEEEASPILRAIAAFWSVVIGGRMSQSNLATAEPGALLRSLARRSPGDPLIGSLLTVADLHVAEIGGLQGESAAALGSVGILLTRSGQQDLLHELAHSLETQSGDYYTITPA